MSCFKEINRLSRNQDRADLVTIIDMMQGIRCALYHVHIQILVSWQPIYLHKVRHVNKGPCASCVRFKFTLLSILAQLYHFVDQICPSQWEKVYIVHRAHTCSSSKHTQRWALARSLVILFPLCYGCIGHFSSWLWQGCSFAIQLLFMGL